jgi:hypothetical protein
MTSIIIIIIIVIIIRQENVCVVPKYHTMGTYEIS